MDSEAIPRAEALRLLASVPVGRIVFSERALPAIQPVAFVFDGDDVVVRTRSGSGLAKAVCGAVVAFEADVIDPVSQSGWSVTVTGQAEQIDGPGRRERLGALPGLWVHGDLHDLIRIPAELVVGRRLVPDPDPAGQRRAAVSG